MPRINTAQAHLLVRKSLVNAGSSGIMAGATARALVGAEAAGWSGHGLSRVPMYTGFLRTGRADGKAVPEIRAERGAPSWSMRATASPIRRWRSLRPRRCSARASTASASPG